MLQVPLIDFLYSTTEGLFRYREGESRLLMSGDFFGITRLDRQWVAANRSTGTLQAFDLDGNVTLESDLSMSHTHQIDLIGDYLFVVNTDRNMIRVLSKDFSFIRDVFPNGDCVRGQSGFCHFNSIYGMGGYVYLIAHNLGEHTGRTSELFVLDYKLDVVTRLDLGTFSCHNLVVAEKDVFLCHSKKSLVSKNGVPLVRHDGFFTRGLSVSRHAIIYGINKVALETRERVGKIVIEGPKSSKLIDAHAPVNDIRQIWFDYGMSQDACKQHNISQEADALSLESICSLVSLQ